MAAHLLVSMSCHLFHRPVSMHGAGQRRDCAWSKGMHRSRPGPYVTVLNTKGGPVEPTHFESTTSEHPTDRKTLRVDHISLEMGLRRSSWIGDRLDCRLFTR